MPLPGKSQRNIWSTGDFLGQCEQWTVVWSPNFGTQKARNPLIVFKTITNCRRKFWMQGFWTTRAFQLLGWWNLCQHGELPKWWLWMITDDYWWLWTIMDDSWLLLMIFDDDWWLSHSISAYPFPSPSFKLPNFHPLSAAQGTVKAFIIRSPKLVSEKRPPRSTVAAALWVFGD